MCANKATSTSCYARLQEVSAKNFYASVDKPVETLRSISDIHEYNTVDRSGNLASPLELENGKVIFIKFEDDEALERSATLEWHGE